MLTAQLIFVNNANSSNVKEREQAGGWQAAGVFL